jgi:hypothetical protein
MGLGFNEGFAFWEHYCKVQKDIMGFEKGTPCDWCGATEQEVLVKPFDDEIAKLGNYVLTRSDYDDADGFVKNWWEIFQVENDDYISVHTIPGFSYSSTGVREYFINFVQKLHNEQRENTI